jgi:rare lipoprotein A
MLLGCQRVAPPTLAPTSPFRQPDTPKTAAFPSAPAAFSPKVIELPAELPSAAIKRDVVFTAPPLADYPFERVATPAEVAQAEAAAGEPADAAKAAPADAAPGGDEPAPKRATGRLIEHGVASTYGEGDGFQGRRTACGQRFDTNLPQIAHKSLPCGTSVRVEDASSGKSVVAKVTDRGPYVAGRVVDLSWAAFSELRSRPGLLSVNVYVMDGQQ